MKKRFKKILSLILVGAMSVSMLTACGGKAEQAAAPAGEEAAPAKEEAATEEATPAAEETASNEAGSTPRNETLYFAGQQWGSINDWNPMSANSNNAMGITQNDASRILIYESLFMYNMLDGKLYGLLGKDYKWNDDQTELTVTMNPDAKWSDGTPVTAEDVAYTFDCHIKYNSSKGNDYGSYIESVTAADDETVVFKALLDDTGKAVNPLKVLGYLPDLYVMQKAYLEKVEERNGEDADKVKQDKMEDLVASGPYHPYYDDDQKVVFERDDNYWGVSLWGGLPAPKYICHNIFADNAACQVALAAGEVDIDQQFITDVQKLWEEDGLPISTYVDEAPYGICASLPTIFYNVEVAGLDDVNVRKAIAWAVDYDQIISSAMSNQSPTFKDVPRSIMNPTEGEQALLDHEALKPYQFEGNDIDGANKLLDDAGIVDTDGDGIREIDGKNLSYKAECPEGWSDWQATLEIVAAAGKNIGIEIETYFPDANTFYDDMTTCKFEIGMFWTPGAAIACPYLRAANFFSKEYAELDVNWSGNYGHYMNDEADAILKKIPNETDTAKLKEYYTELSKIYLEDVPSFTAMYKPQMFHTVNETVWTGYPQLDDGNNIPPMLCTDGYGIAGLYNLKNVEQ
ncbi:MAG: ABC transporter substrate-binding protein [bacterium]|nr:ABC transporter substrate-binding protein [bacterium]